MRRAQPFALGPLHGWAGLVLSLSKDEAAPPSGARP
jgi:hypothetical protein